MKTTHTLAEVRTIISSLLSASSREFQLEFNSIGVQPKEFDDSRKLGVVIFTLATICFNNPEALKTGKKGGRHQQGSTHLRCSPNSG